MIRALIIKDFKANRAVLVVVGLCLVCPYLYTLLQEALMTRPGGNPEWRRMILMAVRISVAFSQLALMILAGNLIAGERAQGSAIFIAALPISRGDIIRSKLTVLAIVATVVWGINYLVAEIELFTRPEELDPSAALTLPAEYAALTATMTMFLSVGVCVCGIAWAVSTVTDSPTYAVTGGAVGTMFVAGLVHSSSLAFEIPRETEAWYWFWLLGLLVGTAAFVGGTFHYARRGEV